MIVGTQRDVKQLCRPDPVKLHARLRVCAMEAEVFEWGNDELRETDTVVQARKAQRI